MAGVFVLAVLVLVAEPARADQLRDCYQTRDADLEITACTALLAQGGLDRLTLAKVHTGLGVALLRNGRTDEAISAHGAAIALAPEFATGWANRGSALNAKGDYAAALADLDRSLRLDPRRAGALNSRAWALLKLGRAADALHDADAALALKPDVAGILDTRGQVNEALGNRDAAIADYRRALELDGALAESRAGLARLGADR